MKTTLTERLIKIRYCTYIISVKFDTECLLQVEDILVTSWNRLLLVHHLDVSLVTRDRFLINGKNNALHYFFFFCKRYITITQ
jgi:hypothetical protein